MNHELASDPVVQFDLRPGDILLIGKREDPAIRTFKVEERIAALPHLSSRIELRDVQTGQKEYYDDRTLAELARLGECWASEVAASRKKRGPIPRRLSLTEKQEVSADRALAYVTGCLSLPDFRRSRRTLKPVIERIANDRGEEKPGFTTVLSWLDSWIQNGDIHGKAALAPRGRIGNRSRRWAADVDTAVRYGVETALAQPKGTAQNAREYAEIRLKEISARKASELPSVRTFQRRMEQMAPYAKDYLRRGARHAERKHSAYYERRRPALPLEEVEVDHTTLDIQVIDPEYDAILGRPDIITFRDRATGVVLGMSIGWEVPSYTSFLQGLRHAIYPKDLSNFPNLQRGWPFHGKFKRLYVDNALHFIGLNIQEAAAELNFELAEFRPGHPWLKGATERFFRTINEALVHRLPGTTTSNVVERQSYDDLQDPCLTIDELEGLLFHFICDDYHYSEHEGLGPLRTLKDVPARLWEKGIDSVKIPLLPEPDIFVALAGDTDVRTIQHYGIEWDYITYQSDTLIPLRQHRNHKPGRGRHGGTKYQVRRDPNDLGRIWVVDPYHGGRIEVPAVRHDYADGLTLHQHRVIIAQHKRTVAAAVDIEGLIAVRQKLAAQVQAMRKDPKRIKLERAVARFLGRQQQKALRSRVKANPPDSEASKSHVDLTDLGSAAPAAVTSPRAPRKGKEASRPAPRTSPNRQQAGEQPAAPPLPKPKHPATSAAQQQQIDRRARMEARKMKHSDWKDV